MAELLEGEHDTLDGRKVNLRKQKKKRGRRPALTRAMAKKIASKISRGASKVAAVESVGIKRSAYYQYMKRGRADYEAGGETIYAYFVQLVLQADANRRTKLEVSTYDHALDDGNLGLRMLGKMDRETWGDHEPAPTLNINIGITPDVRLLAERLSSDELAQLVGLLEKAFAGDDPVGPESTGAEGVAGLHTIDVPGIPRQLASPADSGEA